MIMGSLIYGIRPHEGIVVLRRLDDGTILDHDNRWFEQWESAFRACAEGDKPAAEILADPSEPAAWIPRPSDCWDGEDLGCEAEVVGPGEDVGTGDRFFQISEYAEKELIDKVTAVGLEITRDDEAVDSASSWQLGRCSCGVAVDARWSAGWSYSMVSSAFFEGAIRGYSFEICPRSVDNGSDFFETWVSAWSIDLGDSHELFDRLSKDDYVANPLEVNPTEFADLLRGTGLERLAKVADDLERLAAGESLGDEDDGIR